MYPRSFAQHFGSAVNNAIRLSSDVFTDVYVRLKSLFSLLSVYFTLWLYTTDSWILVKPQHPNI